MRDPDKPQQIIEAAVRVFARRGYYNSRVSDIAREAGIAAGTIYLYFKTKDDILVSLFRDKMAHFVDVVRKAIADEPDAARKVRRLVHLHFSLLEEDPDLAEVLQVELRQGQKFFRGASSQEIGAYFALIAAVLEDGVNDGRFRPDLSLKVATKMLFGAMDQMAYETMTVSREESFAVITLNRPPANAISEGLIKELNAALSELEPDEAVRCLIMTGAGDKIFCAGADLGSAFAGPDVGSFLRFGNSVLRRIERYPKPVIAAINGHALGGGCEISMACHIRILKETARIGQTESNLGIIPGFGGTQRFPRLMGRGLALEHLILGTQMSAQECYRLGFANRLAKEGETLNDAKALAREIAKRPPIASRLIIEAVDDGINAPIDQAIEIEVRAFEKVLKTEDAGEGIQAFFQKRPAQSKGK